LNVSANFQPLYKQVYGVLIRRIAEGEWEPGESLPSEQALASELGVSQGTVRKALDALAAEKLLERRQGRGTFVSEYTQEQSLFRFFRLSTPGPDGRRLVPSSHSDRVRRRTAEAAEREKLGLRKGTRVIEIMRTRTIEDRPAIVENIVVPAPLFPDLDRRESLPNTLYSLYQREYGISIAVAREELRAVAASRREARFLDVEEGAPVLQIDRVAIAIDGRLVERRLSCCDTREIVYAVDVR